MALDDKLDQVKGAVKENVGKLTDDKQMEAEGVVENTVAKVKDAANDIADDVRKLQMTLKMLQKVRLVALKMHWAMMTNKIK